MRLVVQRVLEASVKAEGKTVGSIGKGFLVFVGVGRDDTRETADKYLKKLLGLRIFEDENGKTNLSLKDVNGELLLVSQFTLYANCRKGKHASYVFLHSADQRIIVLRVFTATITPLGGSGSVMYIYTTNPSLSYRCRQIPAFMVCLSQIWRI